MVDRVNVLVVVTTMETGGIELYLINVLRSIDRDRFKVTIACTGSESNWYADTLRELEIPVVYCPNPYSQVFFIRRIGAVMRELGTQTVCDFRGDFAAPTLWAARRCGVRNRMAMYRSVSRLFRPTLSRRTYAALLHKGTDRWATRIVGNSQAVLDAFYPHWRTGDKFAVVYNGVDLELFAPGRDGIGARREFGIDEHAFVVGHVGRFNVAKNHAALIRAYDHIKRAVPEAHLLLVGDGPERPTIENLVSELHLEDSVSLAGRRTDIPDMLAAMDVFVFPSSFEGHPNALLEAMACGLPVVASNIPPVRETIPSETMGTLFDPQDDAGMAGRVIEWHCKPQQRVELGGRLRRHVEAAFSISDSARRLCSYWAENR